MSSKEKIIDHTGIVLTKDAIAIGTSKHELYNYLRENNHSQVAYGVYALPGALEDEVICFFLDARKKSFHMTRRYTIMVLQTGNLCNQR